MRQVGDQTTIHTFIVALIGWGGGVRGESKRCWKNKPVLNAVVGTLKNTVS